VLDGLEKGAREAKKDLWADPAPYRRGSIARRSEGNHSTCRTWCRWMQKPKAWRRLVVGYHWDHENRTPLYLLRLIISSAIEEATYTIVQTARATARLAHITE
jgi:hypothetical protein